MIPLLEDYKSQVDANYFLLLVTIVFLVITFFGAANTYTEWDEGSFLLNAEKFNGDGSNFEESRPAVLSFMISLLWGLTGESLLAARFLVISFGIAAILVFKKLLEHEFDEIELPLAVLAFSPLFLYWSWHVYTDVPALFFILSSIYFFRKEQHVKAGALISIAATFRYIFLIFGFGMAAAYLLENRDHLLEYIGGGFAGSLPLLAYGYLAYGNPLAKVFMYVGKVSGWSGSGLFAATFGNLFSMVHMLSTMLIGVLYVWRQSPLVEKTMLVSYTLFMLVFSGNTFNRYWLAILPITVLMGYRGLSKEIFLFFSVIMIIFSGLAVHGEIQKQNNCLPPLEESMEYAESLEGILVTEQWARAGFYLDKPVYSDWQSLEEMREKENVSHAIMSSEESFKVMEKFSSSCITYYVYDLSSPK